MTVTSDREVHLAEYGELKQEQRDRISFRDRQIYVTLTASAAVAFFAFGGPARYAALLLLPPACFVLGWTYVQNDRKVSEIGQYIRGELTTALGGRADAPLLGWETTHRNGHGWQRRKYVQAASDLLVFCGTGYAAVFAYCAAVAPSVAMVAVACVEAGLLMLLGHVIIRNVR